MPAYSERTRFVVGDEVAHPDGRRGTVGWSDGTSPKTGKKFPAVIVTSGFVPGAPRKPAAAYPWAPLLDHDGPATFRLRCDRCNRPFTSPGRIDECRTCWKKTQAEDGIEDADRSREARPTARFVGPGGQLKAYSPVTGPALVLVPSATPEQRAAIERGRVSEDDSPF